MALLMPEQRLEDIITPMDVSIIGCVVNGPRGGSLHTGCDRCENPQRVLRRRCPSERAPDNTDMIDQLEAKIRAKAAMLDQNNRIDISLVEKDRGPAHY